ncbi:MAG: hypothetical protein U0800_09635 [Isosphaeraceae bacterium]
MFRAGAARTRITPFWGVELTGWGYYIERRWRRIADDLNATAIAVDDGERGAIVVSLDLMVIDGPFASWARSRIEQETGLPPESVLLACTHTHNAPSAGGLLGVGVCDPLYEAWAAQQAATAAILAWNQRQPARFRVAHSAVDDLSFNRTRPGGSIDPAWTYARFDGLDDRPIAALVNFAAHPTLTTESRPWDVGRDAPGLIVDRLEAAHPGMLVAYLQGACGDVNFRRGFARPDRWDQPAERLASAAIEGMQAAAPIDEPRVGRAREVVAIPTRRWEREEIESDRREALRRVQTRDVAGWRETIGRSMTNRPDDMVTRHGGDEWKAVASMCRFHLEWTDAALIDLETRPETLDVELQAIRIGPLTILANPAELFSMFALAMRDRLGPSECMIAGYSNGRVGYLPDAHDIASRSYAGFQSPKYCNQFPFTEKSGPALVSVPESGRAGEFVTRRSPWRPFQIGLPIERAPQA